MESHYESSWNYEWLMGMAYPGSSSSGKYRNGYMQSLLIYENEQSLMTKAVYNKSFLEVKRNVIKGLCILHNRSRNLEMFLAEAENTTIANDLNVLCEKVLDLLHS